MLLQEGLGEDALVLVLIVVLVLVAAGARAGGGEAGAGRALARRAPLHGAEDGWGRGGLQAAWAIGATVVRRRLGRSSPIPCLGP